MKSKVLFTTIGYIEWRKGQDILIDAIEGIPDKILEECEFLLIGQDCSCIARKLKERVTEMRGITIAGTVSREEIHRILDATDVLICPSREDPMPTVCAEAMMHRVPCMVSDAVGTAEYISNYVNGLVFKSEDADGLREQILWCVEFRDALKQMGNEAHKVYEDNFSIAAFEKNLISYVNEMMSMAGDMRK